VNEDYRKDGPQPADERAEYQRIYREALDRKFSTGTVHVYLVGVDGHPFGTLHVANAAKSGVLLASLEKAVAELKVPAGKPLVAPAPQSRPTAVAKGSLVLHLVARGENKGSWREFPGEDWIVFSEVEQARLLPTRKLEPGDSWEPDRELATRILTHFYPQTENNDVSKNRIEEQSLRATAVSVSNRRVRASISGSIRMEHWFYPKPDSNMVNATFSGYMDFDPVFQQVLSLTLVTDKAVYIKENFSVAVRMWSPAKP